MLSEITALLAVLVWPSVVLVLALVFRKDIRQMMGWVKDVKFPGGSLTLEREVRQLEERIGDSNVTSKPTALSIGEYSVNLADSKLAIAQFRLDMEREIVRLSQLGFIRLRERPWNLSQRIDELVLKKFVERKLAGTLKEFLELSHRAIHGELAPPLEARVTELGAVMVAALRRARMVKESEHDFRGNGLWHMGFRKSGEPNPYYWWSAVAASLPLYDYQHDIYKEALESHNRAVEKGEHPLDVLPVLALHEFIQTLEFRERELLRLLQSKKRDEDNKWEWPQEWGNLEWNSSIVRERLSQHAIERDLLRTQSALGMHRAMLVSGSSEPSKSAAQR